jgi:5'(3')-deoxyribonucleotidase
MSKKIITLDLDGVVADIATSIEKYLKKLDMKDANYGDWLITDTKMDLAISIFSDPMFWKNMKPFEDSWHQVNKWFSEGADIYIVTARRTEASMSMTEPWLNDWKINYNQVKFSNINQKHNIIKEIDPLFMVEDNPHEALILREKGVNCYLRKTWYNRDFWSELPTIDSLTELEI